MRIIRIISDGMPIEVYDEPDTSLEEATQYVTNLLKGDKIVELIGKHSSAIIRPSSVSAINIIDEPIEDQKAQLQKEPNKKQEQNNENVDMIVDIDEE